MYVCMNAHTHIYIHIYIYIYVDVFPLCCLASRQHANPGGSILPINARTIKNKMFLSPSTFVVGVANGTAGVGRDAELAKAWTAAPASAPPILILKLVFQHGRAHIFSIASYSAAGPHESGPNAALAKAPRRFRLKEAPILGHGEHFSLAQSLEAGPRASGRNVALDHAPRRVRLNAAFPLWHCAYFRSPSPRRRKRSRAQPGEVSLSSKCRAVEAGPRASTFRSLEGNARRTHCPLAPALLTMA